MFQSLLASLVLSNAPVSLDQVVDALHAYNTSIPAYTAHIVVSDDFQMNLGTPHSHKFVAIHSGDRDALMPDGGGQTPRLRDVSTPNGNWRFWPGEKGWVTVYSSRPSQVFTNVDVTGTQLLDGLGHFDSWNHLALSALQGGGVETNGNEVLVTGDVDSVAIKLEPGGTPIYRPGSLRAIFDSTTLQPKSWSVMTDQGFVSYKLVSSTTVGGIPVPKEWTVAYQVIGANTTYTWKNKKNHDRSFNVSSPIWTEHFKVAALDQRVDRKLVDVTPPDGILNNAFNATSYVVVGGQIGSPSSYVGGDSAADDRMVK